MSETINKFESKRGRPPKHPWNSWADKKARKLYKGTAEEVARGDKDFEADLRVLQDPLPTVQLNSAESERCSQPLQRVRVRTPTLALLQPDVHCKGAEYAPPHGRPLPERATVEGYGGRIVFLPLLPGISTSALIRRR